MGLPNTPRITETIFEVIVCLIFKISLSIIMKSPIFKPVVVALVIDIVELEIETPEDNVAEIPE